ncbi:MAG: ABC transporter substrate-binding protein [Anaerolineae bacterium]|nr:ABC transporter substrate-binding protein [Anaerolineae bacterium]
MKRFRLLTLAVLIAVVAALVPAAQAQEGVEIKYWSLWNEGEPAAELLKSIAADYQAASGNTVNITFAGREIVTKLRTALNAGEAVDLVDFDAPSLFGALVTGDAPLVMDLTEALAGPAYGADTPWSEMFVPGFLDQYKMETGETYFIPYQVITTAFWYDQRIFDEAGVEAAPQTWDEFIAAMDKIKEAGYAPLTQDAQVWFYNLMWFYLLSARLNGPGALYAAAADETGEAWLNPNWGKIIEMERQLWEGGYIIEGAEGFVWPAGQQELALGNAAIELCGSWLPNELKAIVDEGFIWRMFPMPEVEGGVGTINDAESYLIGWMVMNDAPNPDTAIDFMKFATQDEYMTRMAADTIEMVSTQGIEPPVELIDMAAHFESAETFFPPYDNVNADYPDWYTNVLGKLHDDAFFGRITPEEFMQQMQEQTAAHWAEQ